MSAPSEPRVGFQAVRKHRDPFRLGRLLAVIRWTSYQCPLCARPFKITWGPNAVLLGPGERTCKGCGTSFYDGSKEWPELSPSEKEGYLLPVSVAGVLAGFLLSLVLGLYEQFYGSGNVDPYALFVFVGLPLAFLGMWFLFRARAIKSSKERYFRASLLRATSWSDRF